jgi:hypothetical protein
MNRRERRHRDRLRDRDRARVRTMLELFKKIKVVSEVEAELADVVVCLPLPDPGYFPDNITGTCARCGIGIFYRPHVPILPPKVCINCAAKMAEEERESEQQAEDSATKDGQPPA